MLYPVSMISHRSCSRGSSDAKGMSSTFHTENTQAIHCPGCNCSELVPHEKTTIRMIEKDAPALNEMYLMRASTRHNSLSELEDKVIKDPL